MAAEEDAAVVEEREVDGEVELDTAGAVVDDGRESNGSKTCGVSDVSNLIGLTERVCTCVVS